MKKAQDSLTYTYYHYNSVTNQQEPIVIHAGEDGVTEEHIIMLQDMDHREELDTRYYHENLDPQFEGFKVKVDNAIFQASTPWDYIEDETATFSDEDVADTPRIEQLKEVMKDLSEDQVNLIYELYGLNRGFTEIARQEGVSETAIRNRNKNIINRLRRLLGVEVK